MKTMKFVKQDVFEKLMTCFDENDDHGAEFCKIAAERLNGERNGKGIVLGLFLAIRIFVQSGYPPVMEQVLAMQVDEFLEAIVNDQEVLADALEMYEAVING